MEIRHDVSDHLELCILCHHGFHRVVGLVANRAARCRRAQIARCFPAINGREALGLFTDHQVIMTDWNMPEMSGVEFIRELRKTHPSPNPYVIMLTSENDTRGIIKALEEGVDSYIMKPFNINDLKRKMKQVEDLF